jgi:hypothetical protein
MPITPEFIAIVTHDPKVTGYLDVPSEPADNFNLRTIGMAHSHFVSQTSETVPHWFLHPAFPRMLGKTAHFWGLAVLQLDHEAFPLVQETAADNRGNCDFTCVVRVASLGITNVAIAFIGVFPLLMPS